MSTKPTFNDDQKETFKKIVWFIDHPSANTFILKGYAGTGKTFLMQHLGEYLKKKEINFSMLASTGRAASVLRGKTGFITRTVHSELYNFSGLEGFDAEQTNHATESKSGQISMQFATREPDKDKRIYIVDEASMLSGDVSTDTAFATFGSGILLNDLFEVLAHNKVIFVGDPCQLPPVKQAFSPALDVKWAEHKDRVVIDATLRKIERTDPNNEILKLATAVREMIGTETIEKFPRLPASGLGNVLLHASEEELFRTYAEYYKEHGVNGALAIARSNKTVQNINRAMRREIFGRLGLPLQIGDVLLVTQNNYKVPLTNGDFVTVQELGELKETIGLKFQKIKVRSVASDVDYDLLLSLDALNAIKGNLTDDQLKDLMIDFNQSMRAKYIKPNTEEYKAAMLEDEFLNCLRATYGYAVTCHKSQGGEWDNVFLFLDKSMYGMPGDELFRWWYTAITRAKKQLHLQKGWWVR